MSSCSSANVNLMQVKKELVSIWEFESDCFDRHFERGVDSGIRIHHNFPYKDSDYFDRMYPKWHFIDKEMSSNVAGETGAVWIYKGALAATRYRKDCENVEDFARQHMATEQQHLDYMQEIVPTHMHTRLLNIWKLAGFLLGFLPTIVGKGPALYHTVEAVESFVEIHYKDQIRWLQDLEKEFPLVFDRANVKNERAEYSRNRNVQNIMNENRTSSELIRLLTLCCEDEVEHKLDAKRRLLGVHEQENEDSKNDIEVSDPKYSLIPRMWRAIVDFGSASAAQIARHF